MSNLSEPRNTVELHTGGLRVNYERESAAAIFAGALVAQNGSGNAVPASDAAGLTVLGRAEHSAATGEKVLVRTGVYLFDNGASGEALSPADIGAVCYVVDDHTVGKAGGTYHCPAGIVIDVTEDGVAVLVSPLAVAGARTAAPTVPGLVKQAAAVADCTPAASDATSVETQLNALLAALRTAGVIAGND